MKTVYYKNKDKDSNVVFETYTMDDIDADYAVIRHPKEYSYEAPKDPKAKIVDKMVPNFVNSEDNDVAATADGSQK